MLLLLASNQFIISENTNRGVSLLEQFKSDQAEKELRQALNPDFKVAKINLAISF